MATSSQVEAHLSNASLSWQSPVPSRRYSGNWKQFFVVDGDIGDRVRLNHNIRPPSALGAASTVVGWVGHGVVI